MASRSPAPDAPTAPPAAPAVADGAALALAVRAVAAIAAAASTEPALREAAAALADGLTCREALPFRISGVTRTHVVVASVGSAAPAVPDDVPLDQPVGQALMAGRVHVEAGGARAWVPVRRDAQPIGGLRLAAGAGRFDGAAAAGLLEIVRIALDQRAQADPLAQAALALPALSREFAEVLDDNLFITNPERDHFEFLTGSTLDTWGLTRQQFMEHPESLGAMVVDEDRPLLAQRRQRERAGEPCDVSFRIRHPAKGLRWLRSRTRTLRGADGTPRVYGIVSDITAERQRAADLERALDAAESASRAKSQFMANMSHEIRTPMNGILGMTELLLGTPLTGEQRRFAEAVYASGESLLEIINDVLDFSKIEAGRLELAPTDFSPRAVAEDTLELLAPRAHAKRLEIGLLVHPGVPERLHGDALRLRQVLTNLVANAIKFTEHGEVVVEMACAREGASAVVRQIEFRIRDTGIGIERKALGQLFSAFTQGHSGTRKRYGGTGLGLVIVRRLVELMGGTIEVQSAPGIGSEFTVRLPFRAAQTEAGGEADLTELAGLRALVVDDNATNRQVLETLLQGWGIAVTLAEDGEQALERLRAQAGAPAPFDLAVVDMHMPGLDGLQLGHAVREAGLAEGLQMIMLSSASSADEARAVREAGYQRFVAKPVRRAELYRAIQGVAAPPAAPAAALVAPSCDVLVVEDNGVNRQVIEQMLKSLGCRAQLASGAMEGLRALCDKRYDLILMDVQMPGMDGIEALHAFRRGPGSRFAFVTPPDTPVIAVTANALPEDETRLRSLGFDDYLAKPFRRSQLLAMLNQRLNPGAPAAPCADVPAVPTAAAEVPAGAAPSTAGVLDAGALDRLRELDPKGENQLLPRVLGAFQTSTSRLVPQVQAACAAGDLAGVRHVAHTLKSSSASIGALRLAQMCSEIETMIRQDKVEFLTERVTAMCAEIDTVLQALRHLLDGKA